MPHIRVSILGDDPIFRAGLRQLLSSDSTFASVDADRVPSIESVPSAADILLVDSRMDGVFERCARFDRDRRPYLIFLSVADDAAGVDALAAGARGIVRRCDAIADVVRAIKTVHAGSVWAPRHVVVETWLRQRRGAPAIDHRLSAREHEVVRCVALGMSNRELAEHLGIRLATVKAHLTRVFQKLDVNGRGELIAAYHGTRVPGARERFPARVRARA
jgi:DNA-binding NarL/FixJ family response regulator